MGVGLAQSAGSFTSNKIIIFMSTKKKTDSQVATKKAVAKVVKKSPVKKVAKKVVKKNSHTKTSACDCKKKCANDIAFWVNNGPVVHSLQELLSAMESMSDKQFEYHTKRQGNDFSNWVRDCLLDKESATKLRRVKTRVGAVRVLTSICACR